MKWYSIKKHRPYTDGYCLVRTENGCVYCAEWRNSTDDDHADYSCGWMMPTMAEEYNAPISIELFGITHFCIPEPVEIEE